MGSFERVKYWQKGVGSLNKPARKERERTRSWSSKMTTPSRVSPETEGKSRGEEDLSGIRSTLSELSG